MSRARIARLIVVFFVATAFASARAGAEAPSADELLERGLRSYAVGRYAEAIAAFRAGFELDPKPDFLYALAQAQRMSGDCAAAVPTYRSFLRTGPSERAAEGARQNLQRCESQRPPAAPPVAAPAARPAVVTAPAPPPRRRWQRDAADAALTAVGLAVAGAGGALWGAGEAGVQSANARYDQFAAGQTADHTRIAGVVGVAVGGALLVGGLVRYLWVARRR